MLDLIHNITTLIYKTSTQSYDNTYYEYYRISLILEKINSAIGDQPENGEYQYLDKED